MPVAIRLLAAAFAFTLIAASPAQNSSSVPALNLNLPFEVTLPPGFQVVKRDGPDFLLYYFNKGNVTYAGVYEGFAPQWGNPQGAAIQQDVTCKDGAPASRNILLRIGDNEVLHIWTMEDAGRGADAEAIVTSIRVRGKNDGIRARDLKAC